MADKGFGLLIDIGFEAYSSVDKKLKSMLKKLSKANELKVNVDQKAFSQIEKQFDDLNKKISANTNREVKRQQTQSERSAKSYEKFWLKALYLREKKQEEMLEKIKLEEQENIRKIEESKLDAQKAEEVRVSRKVKMYTQMFDALRQQETKRNKDAEKQAQRLADTEWKAVKARATAEVQSSNDIQAAIAKTISARRKELEASTKAQAQVQNRQQEIAFISQQKNIYGQLNSTLRNIFDIKKKMLGADSNLNTELQKQLQAEYSKLRALKQQKTTTGVSSQEQQNQLIQKAISLRDRYNQSLARSQDAANNAGRATIKANTGIMGSLTDMTKKAATWAVTMTGVYAGFNQIRKAVSFTNEFNKSLTEIGIVTGMTQAELGGFSKELNKLSIQFAQSQDDVAKSAVTFIRQGKSQAETIELIKTNLIAGSIAGTDLAETAELLTSTMNGFGLESSEVLNVVDKFAKVGASTATSFEEISRAMSRTATSAQITGVSMDALIGYIGTVSAVTRKSADTVGESFKTLFSRFESIQKDYTAGDKGPLNNVERELNKVDIALRDGEDSFRNLEDVIDDVAGKWDKLTDVEKASVSTAIAGTRQRENFNVLMENYSQALELERLSLESNGTALQQYNKYLEGNESAIKTLIATTNELYQRLITSEGFQAAIQNVTKFVGSLGELAKKFGGVGTALTFLIPVIGIQLVKATKTATLALIEQQVEAGVLSSGTIGLSQALGLMKTAMFGTAVTAEGATVALTGLNLAAGALTLGLTLIPLILMKITNHQRELREELKQTIKDTVVMVDTTNRIDSLIDKYEELKNAGEDTSEISAQLAENLREGIVSYDENGNAILDNVEALRSLNDEKKREIKFRLQNAQALNKENYDEAKEKHLELKKSYDEMREALERGERTKEGYIKTDDGMIYTAEALRKKLQKLGGQIDDNREIIEEYEENNKKLEALNKTQVDTIVELTEMISDQSRVLTDAEKIKTKVLINETQKRIRAISAEMQAMTALGGVYSEKYNSIMEKKRAGGNLTEQEQRYVYGYGSSLSSHRAQIQYYEDQIKIAEDMLVKSDTKDDSSGGGGGKGGDKDKDKAQKALKEAYSKQNKELEYQLTLIRSQRTELSNTSKEYQNNLHAENLIYQKQLDLNDKFIAKGLDRQELQLDSLSIIKQMNDNSEDWWMTLNRGVDQTLKQIDYELQENSERMNGITEGSQQWYDVQEDNLMILKNQRFITEEYINQLRDQVDLNKLNGKELEDAQEKVKQLNLSYMKINNSISSIEKSLIKQNEETLKAREEIEDKLMDIIKDRIEEEIDEEEKHHEKVMNRLEKEHQEKLKNLEDEQNKFEEYINEQLNLIDKRQKKESFEEELVKKQEERAKTQKRISELALVGTGDRATNIERKQLEEQLKKQNEDINKFINERNINLTKDALKDELNEYKKNAKDKKEVLDDEFKEAQERENAKFERHKARLDRQLENENLYNEARRMMEQSTTSELISLVWEYERENGKAMGSAGDSIYNNLVKNLQMAKREVFNLKDAISQLEKMKSMKNVDYDSNIGAGGSDWSDKQVEANEKANQARSYLVSQGYSQGASDISSYGYDGAKDWYDEYISDRTDLSSGVKNAFKEIVNAKRDWANAAQFRVGGKTPDNVPDSGAWAVLHKNERILNEDYTRKFDTLMNMVSSVRANGIDGSMLNGGSKTDLSIGSLINIEGNVDKSTVPQIKQVADQTLSKLTKILNGNRTGLSSVVSI